MYLEYYGLKREPFHITPDPSFLYLSPSHKEALGAIIYGVEKRKGFIAIIGEVGVGKTSILRAYLERKASQKQKTIYIFNPVLSFHDLLISMFRSLELTPRQDNIPEMVNQLHEALIAEYQAGGTVVVAIDEAQNMPVETLENLRMFSNLETSTDKLIQIILLGQPELDNLLQQAVLRQLKQRIVLWATILPLTREDSLSFIEHRIARACTTGASLLFAESENAPELFTKSALNLIVRKANGIPRKINIFCDNALITGFGRQCKPVSISVVREIIGDIETREASKPFLNIRWAVGLSVAILFILGLMFFLDSSWRTSRVEIQSTAEYVDGNVSGPHKNSIPQSLPVVAQPDQSQNTDMMSEQVSKNVFDGNERSTGLQSESSKAKFKSLSSLDVQSKVLADSKQSPDTLHQGVASKSDRNGIGPRATLNKGSSELSEHARVAGPKKKSEARSVLERGRARSKLKNTTRAVREGESLSQIAMEAYGSQSEEYVEWVKRHNPQIVNPDLILPGQNIVLPTYSKNKDSQ